MAIFVVIADSPEAKGTAAQQWAFGSPSETLDRVREFHASGLRNIKIYCDAEMIDEVKLMQLVAIEDANRK